MQLKYIFYIMRGVTGPIEEIILSVSRLKVPNFIRTPSSRRAKDVSKFCVNYNALEFSIFIKIIIIILSMEKLAHITN